MAHIRPGGACGGYFIEDGPTLLIDLRERRAFAPDGLHVHPVNLDAIVLSHLHFDHCSDLLVMRYALSSRTCAREKRRVPAHTPAEPFETLKTITNGALFAQHTVKGGDEIQIGTLRFSFVPMAHPVPTNGMRITGADGATLFFTGDTKPYRHGSRGNGRGRAACGFLLCGRNTDRPAPEREGSLRACPKRGSQDAVSHTSLGEI